MRLPRWNPAASKVRLVDLGVILAADCTGGNSVDLQPLIGASVGDFVQLLIANTDFVQHDSDGTIDVFPYNDNTAYQIITWGSSYATVGPVMTFNYALGNPYIEDGQPLLMSGSGSLATVGAIHLKALVVPG